MKNTLRLTAAALLLLVLACDLLPLDEFQPTGTQFTLNSDIQVASITGNPNLSNYGPFTMGMTVSSRTGSTVTDVLPAGLLLVRRDNSTQHMLLLKDQTVTAGSGSSTVLLGAFCCNEHRSSPDAGDAYDIGPVTDNSDLARLASIVKGKDISRGTDMWMVQRAVYLVTDSTGLTQAYIDSVNALPADTP